MDNRSQEKSFAILRIVFGIVWLIDAFFKWSPQFINNFTDYLTSGIQGQPILVQNWINFWVQIISINPRFFAVVVAILETAIALSLLSGILSKIAMYGGIVLTLVIWSTAEGFGGPYSASSTDIGAAIIYALLFVALLFGKSWERFRLDVWLRNKIGR